MFSHQQFSIFDLFYFRRFFSNGRLCGPLEASVDHGAFVVGRKPGVLRRVPPLAQLQVLQEQLLSRQPELLIEHPVEDDVH